MGVSKKSLRDIRRVKKLIDVRRSICVMGTGYKTCKACTVGDFYCWEYEASILLARVIKEETTG